MIRSSLLLLQLVSVVCAIVLEPSVLVRESDPFGPTVAKDDDGVPSLTSQTFDAFVQSKPMAIVAFVAPWCGFCKKLKSGFAAAAKDIAAEHNDVLQLARVDCVAESELYDRFKIEGFPTIKLFHYGVFANAFQSKDLSYNAIISYARGWANQPDAITGWLHAETLEDVFHLLEVDDEHHGYTSPIPTLLTLLDPTKINSDDSRMVLQSLANASFAAETKHTRFVVTTDRGVMDEFMQITPDCGLTEVRHALTVSFVLPCTTVICCRVVDSHSASSDETYYIV